MRLKVRERIKPRRKEPTEAYYKLRYWWLHWLRQLRAKRRVSGTATVKEIKAAQRELARIRKEEMV